MSEKILKFEPKKKNGTVQVSNSEEETALEAALADLKGSFTEQELIEMFEDLDEMIENEDQVTSVAEEN